uniref:Clan AA aspartic protease, AF_0612 family n=1 Tax=Candidatus Kentrum sp. FM TaxID=2126340 RepID=A0A450TSV0_9GAMM|nr:MAG: clan AA aspartic protease, AF_0612 family [Candidatus Kentron sp. FM]VFJ71536.1 MAG: clan AA aspartic protease, AF_0612 family [Candidatus Kentron sp. FM]VFK18907.1 MAG: clan AA aspartic protease, AF_0612 family [Candidatus Kentron sp. FM]
MGPIHTKIHTKIRLSNPKNTPPTPLEFTALVDTGAITLCIPQRIADRLNLAELEKRQVTTAEGRHIPVPYVGPIQVTFQNRNCFTGALVLGDDILLGAVPLEDMDLVVNPRLQQVTVNPQSPSVPSAIVK